jgi:signal transduction histidine kinase
MPSIPPKVLTGFAVTVVAIGLFTAVTVHLFGEQSAVAAATIRGFETGRRVDTLSLRLAELESSERTYVLTGDPDARAACEDAGPALNTALTMLHASLSGDPEGLRRNELLGTLVAQRLAIVGRITAVTRGGLAGAGVTALLTQGAVIDARARDILRALGADNQARTEAARARWDRLTGLSQRELAVGMGFLVLLVLAAGRLVVRDIDARRTLNDQLRDERQRLHEVLGAIPIGVLLVEAPSRNVLFANDEARRLLHLDAAELAAKPFILKGRRVQDPEGRPRSLDELPVARAMRGEHVVSEDLVICSDDPPRDPAIVRGSAIPIRDAAGRVRAVVSAFMDIRERKRFEDFQRWVVGIVGHDLRTPLAAIDLTVGRLIENRAGDLAADVMRGLRRIASSSGRMRHLIDELLDFNRARFSGGIPIEPRGAELMEIVRDQVAELETLAPGRTSVVAPAEGDATIWGRWDPGRIGQLVANLVKNAIQHGEGTVEIAVDHTPGEIVLSVHNQNRAGPIPPELLPHLFDPFRRGTDSPSGGLGLGLYIACEIARAHGGEIHVRSTEEEGTTFTARLPRIATAAGGDTGAGIGSGRAPAAGVGPSAGTTADAANGGAVSGP